MVARLGVSPSRPARRLRPTLGRLGAQLVLQRAVENEVAAFLRRAR